jgi:hypothetical protein
MTISQAIRAVVVACAAVALFVCVLLILHGHKRDRYFAVDASGNPDAAIHRFMDRASR